MPDDMQNKQEENETAVSQKEAYAELLKRHQRFKKAFLKALLAIAAVLSLLLIIVVVSFFSQENSDSGEKDIFFYPPYPGDILAYEPYLELDRKIYYHDGRVILSVEEDNLQAFDQGVLFLRSFINSMIAGNAERYNSYFTVNPNQPDFSPQMIYDIQIIYESTGNAANGDQLITYRLEYRIYHNDGTLCRDVESGAVKTQFVVLRITENGDVSIERLSTTR